MGAIGYTSGDPQKVDVAGDTMTGDLVLSGATTDLTVGGVITDTFQGVTGDVMRFITSTLSTGITTGGSISINVNPALIDIEATTGWVVDYDPTSPYSATNPQLTQVNFAGQSGILPLFPFTFWLITSAGTVIQQATIPTPTQFRTHLFLGACGVVGGIVQGFANLPYLSGQTGVQMVDLMRSLGPFNTSGQGNLITANGANLMINTSGGGVFSRAFNLPNYQDPHTATLAAQTPIQFHRMTATAIIPGLVTTLDVGNYDPNGLGIITPIGGGANTTTIHRVYATATAGVTDQITVQYGQHTYATISTAVNAIGSGAFIPNFTTAGATLLGWVCPIRTATDLSNLTQATFVHASRFPAP